MTYYARSDETSEWLNYLQPEGLVVGPNVLRDKGLTPIRQTPLDTDQVAEILGLNPEDSRDDDKHYVLRDPWVFFEKILQWPASFVAGSPDGSDFPEGLDRVVPEHETGLSPDMAVLWRENAVEGVPAQLLVTIHPELDPDKRDQFGPNAWEASPHQRLERLLRETGVGAGILIARNTLRLVYAPRGETAGWMSWPLAALGRVEGRPMLAGLKLCLGRAALFTGAPEARLRTILKDSRESQNEVSEKLSVQVLGALHELLRGLYVAAPSRIEALADSDPHHLYEGLLTCLMRLVFLLYAEDRDLLPSSPDPQLKALWEGAYSIKTLYARLLTDEALNPDTMDARRGAWGQLLAVFRIIHDGYGAGWVARRGGKLFDPNAFSFLEGRDTASARGEATVLPISDGCILRILHGVMTVEARGLNGAKIRERLSYRSLDVESIGSVYETVMGFTTHRATEPMIALKDDKKLPTFVGLDTLSKQKPADRQKWLKESAISLSAKQLTGIKTAASQAELLEAFGSAIDDRASPGGHPIGTGAPYLQPTEERRRSGSHYTPRSLTEPIVRHALEPAFERIGLDAPPEAVLELKILDPACGSGAFLVEACRQLGTRLEQAWDMHKAEKPEIPSDEDEAIHARRLVAQRCLYGVDRNPMAVDLARLSLWLATLAREHEFSFLDHALKSGDSLVGLTQREITAVHWDASKPGLQLLGNVVKERVGKALLGREAIRNAPDSAKLEEQLARHGRVEEHLETARIIGDTVVAAFFSSDKPKEREIARAAVESEILASGAPQWDRLKTRALDFRLMHGWRPFHWEIEFPEAFARENPGFDAIVGNPPFLGGTWISGRLGSDYLAWLKQSVGSVVGRADLCAYFFRRCYELLRLEGYEGFVATNTIKQGDTRELGLSSIIRSHGKIIRAVTRYQWPGEAAVIVSIIHIARSARENIDCELNELSVPEINSFLISGKEIGNPARLMANNQKSFKGVDLYSMGFTFDDTKKDGSVSSLSKMDELISADPNLRSRIRPYIGGEEINSHPQHSPHRFAIFLTDLSEKDAKAGFPQLMDIVEEKVLPERLKLKYTPAAQKLKVEYWKYNRDRPNLLLKLSGLKTAFAVSQVSPHLAVAKLPSSILFANYCIVFTSDEYSFLSTIQSRVHEIWARFFSSSMKDDLRYAPSDCFETFPFPPGYETDATLEHIGQTYHDHRAALMIAANEGMTKTYNRFHKETERGEAINHLRELHDQMDQAVLRAYGWDDLADVVQPQFLTEATEDDHTYQNRYFWPAEQRDKVLSRLLALNAERHAEEIRLGVAPKLLGKKSADDADDSDQTDLDFD